MLSIDKIDNSPVFGFYGQEAGLIKRALNQVAPYMQQPSVRPRGPQVAEVLSDLNVDAATLIAAILSEPLMRDDFDYEDTKQEYSEEIADLVKDVNWLNTLNVYNTGFSSKPQQAESLRRMLLAMTQDVRSVLIKLAFRVARLRALRQEKEAVRLFVARETLDIYAPISNRLGIGQLKWELEDLAFRYLEPETYHTIAKSLADKREQRESCIAKFTETLKNTLKSVGVGSEIYGRPKHIYSIWKKMQRKQLPIDELYDLLAVRVIVDKVSSCYAVLGEVHSLWKSIPKEFDDYIANPKENGYQSLHTVILDEQGNRIEIQIRTREMHEFAELGVAAHWRYKEGGKQDEATDRSINSLRQLLEDKNDNESLLENFRSELFSDRVFVLTPNGQLVDLLKGATPLDFAYSVHTEVGHRCRGAKVNGRIVPLTYVLQSGEQVEILTAKEGGPNRNWIDPNLGYLHTPRAISKVKSWLRHQQQEQNEAAGKHILAKEIQKLALEAPDFDALCLYFHMDSREKLLAAIGRGDISTRQIAGFLQVPAESAKELIKKQKTSPAKAASSISVQGVDNLLTHFAQCCNPVPGDPITGFISQSRGITVHRSDCSNVNNLSVEQQARLVAVNWGAQEPGQAVPIVIQAYDRRGLLNDVTRVLDQNKINIVDANFKSHEDLSSTLELIIQISDTEQLSKVLSKIGMLPNVYEVRRKN